MYAELCVKRERFSITVNCNEKVATALKKRREAMETISEIEGSNGSSD